LLNEIEHPAKVDAFFVDIYFMRAQLVESSEFKRGINPKEASKIGMGPEKYLDDVRKILNGSGLLWNEKVQKRVISFRIDDDAMIAGKFPIHQIYLYRNDFNNPDKEDEAPGWEFDFDNEILYNPIESLLNHVNTFFSLIEKIKLDFEGKQKNLQITIDSINNSQEDILKIKDEYAN
jgi:hypothetical protein